MLAIIGSGEAELNELERRLLLDYATQLRDGLNEPDGNGANRQTRPIKEQAPSEPVETGPDAREGKADHSPIQADDFDYRSRNDRFGKEEQRYVIDHLKLAPIRDLKKEIGLNDRFWFVNELFGGNVDAYDKVIKRLDAFDSLEKAMGFIAESLETDYDWSDKPDIRKKLILLVERRHQTPLRLANG